MIALKGRAGRWRCPPHTAHGAKQILRLLDPACLNATATSRFEIPRGLTRRKPSDMRSMLATRLCSRRSRHARLSKRHLAVPARSREANPRLFIYGVDRLRRSILPSQEFNESRHTAPKSSHRLTARYPVLAGMSAIRIRDDDLMALLDDTESDRTERKQAWSGGVSDKARQAVCAFANDLIGPSTAGCSIHRCRR